MKRLTGLIDALHCRCCAPFLWRLVFVVNPLCGKIGGSLQRWPSLGGFNISPYGGNGCCHVTTEIRAIIGG
jgi:hypothetical protein